MTSPLVSPKEEPKANVPWALIGLRGYLGPLVIQLHLVIWSFIAKYDLGVPYLEFGSGRLVVNRAAIVFFLHSAYMLTLKFLREVKLPHERTWKDDLKTWGKFAIGRFMRVYPNWTANNLFLLLFPHYVKFYDIAPMTLPAFLKRLALLGVKNLVWTLPVEMEYYLCIPVVIMLYKWGEAADSKTPLHQGLSPTLAALHGFLFRSLSLVPFSLIAWYLYPVQTLKPSLVPSDPQYNFALEPWFLPFWLGSLSAIAAYNLEKYRIDILTIFKDPVVRNSVIYAPGIATWVAFCIMSDLQSLISPVNNKGELQRVGGWVPNNVYMTACVALVFLGGAMPVKFPGSWASLMSTKPMVYLGSLTLAIYLWHPVAIQVCHELISPNMPLRFVIIYAVNIVFGVLVHQLIEIPGIQAGASIARLFDKWVDKW